MEFTKISIHCPHCSIHTSVEIAMTQLGSKLKPEIIAAFWQKNNKEEWWIGVCNYCDNPVLILNEGEKIFPHPQPHPTDNRIPEEIRNDLIEAKLCFSISAYRATAVMARRTMQSACMDKGASKSRLVDQINELKEKGIITNDLKNWADVVRWVGNDAAHPNIHHVEKEDAEDILSLAEQFFHVIYVAPAIAQEKITQRNSREKGAP